MVVDFVDRGDKLVYLAISAADVHRLPAIRVEHPNPGEAALQAEISEPR